MILFYFSIRATTYQKMSGFSTVKSLIFLKNLISHINLIRHFEFSRKSFFKNLICTQKVKKQRKKDKTIIFENIG
jgi:hypothetical protein